jgi:hypothetical protein
VTTVKAQLLNFSQILKAIIFKKPLTKRPRAPGNSSFY